MATLFPLMILVGIVVIVVLARLDSGGIRNEVPSRMTMVRTRIDETRDTGFPG